MATQNANTSGGVLQGTILISLKDINVDEKFNARREYDGEKGNKKDSRGSIEDLAESIKRDGQLQPVLLRKDPKGKFFLLYGFRRFKAMEHLKEETIKAEIWEGEEKDAYLINLAENTARNDLLSWELALRCKEIRDKFGLTGDAIAQRTTKSTKYVLNLLRIMDKVHPKIVKEWQEGNGLATTDYLTKLAAKDQAEQWEEWVDAASDDEETDGEEEGDETEGKEKKVNRPSRKQLEKALAALRKCDKPADWKEGCRAALKFALGQNRTIPGVFNPDAKEAKEAGAEE